MSDRKLQWPPDYLSLYKWRQAQLFRMRSDPVFLAGALEYYRTRPFEFVNHWVDTFDPRNAVDPDKPTRMPFVMFEAQRNLFRFLGSLMAAKANGLIEKARDAGVTWGCCAFSVHLWRFVPDSASGFGSRKEDLVDTIGDLDSIFEKVRVIIRNLPPEFYPRGFTLDDMHFMKVINPENGASITGESGDNIGRGGRKSIYFVDEAAHIEHPELVEAALLSNTDVHVDVSSVSQPGSVFHNKRKAGVDWEPGRPAIRGKTNVYVIDWRDDPRKTKEWFETTRQEYDEKGLPHIFAREVERNYHASVSGIIIPAEYVQAAMDAHKVLGFEDDGGYCSGLDVGDSTAEDGDRNAQVIRKGVVLRFAQQWTERDPGVTARRAIDNCLEYPGIEMQYDCIGVGTSVKAEWNRLTLDDPETAEIVKGVQLVPWNAGAAVLFPHRRTIPYDDKSPFNKDFYHNLKAQGWWELRMRFLRTWRAVEAKKKGKRVVFTMEARKADDGAYYVDSDTLISIDTALIPKAVLRMMEDELSRPVSKKSAKMKLVVDKMPAGARSPNIADAMVMCYWPVPATHVLLGAGPKVFVAGQRVGA